MLTSVVDSALNEVTFLKRECLSLVDDSLALCPPIQGGQYPDAFRMVVTPFLYAVWERCFTTNFAIMAKILHHESSSPSVLSSPQAALWLQAEPFFDSFSTKIRDGISPGKRKSIRSGKYKALTEFINKYRGWECGGMNSSIDTSSLVMTFSNVNCEVLDVNAEAIGLNLLPEFLSFRKSVGRLEDLVGRRNDIGHGTMSRPPKNREFQELVDLTKNHLIAEFCDVVQYWIIFR